MIIIAINLTLVAFILLPLGAITLGVTIYFFLKSRESLMLTMGQKKKPAPVSKKEIIKPEKEKPATFKRSTLVELEEQFARKRYESSHVQEEPLVQVKKPAVTEDSVHDLKASIAHQQKMLNDYLAKVEELENGGKEQLVQQNNALQKEITKLHGVIEEKDAEIEDLQQQVSSASKMAEKIEEVYQEFDQLQSKMAQLEKQANKANNLAIELEDTKHSYEQIHKELLRKQERLEEVMSENQRMRQDMNVIEDKLSDANLQRQQLLKKVQFLQELNTDMQSISDTNKKLQTELRRIGELESMLNMMAEERDYLLRKKFDK
jgi:chromosome segregation ATPase